MNVLTVNFSDKNAAQNFCLSLKETGFAVLENHPVDRQLIADTYHEWRSFFASDDKNNYHFNRETQDGFFPKTISECAKGATEKDIKEYFQYYTWGQFPHTMGENTKKLYAQLNALAHTLLDWLESCLPEAIANTLSMPLTQMIERSQQTMLRILHYPPFEGNEPMGSVRAAEHEDINLITLLVGATASGLQVKDAEGQWLEIPCSSESIIVNVGDMLDLATNHYYVSTTHRVVNPDASNEARLSMPLFLHPRPDVSLSTDKTAGQYLHERLTELGVI